MKPLITVAIRYFLLSVFGAMSAYGYMNESLVEPIIGLATALFAIGWYYFTVVRKGKTDIHELEEEMES